MGTSSLISDWTQAPCIWEWRVLATGPPGQSQNVSFKGSLPLHVGVALAWWKPRVAFLIIARCYWLPFHWPSKRLAPKSAHILAREFWADLVSRSLVLFGCFCLCCICCIWLQCPLHTWPKEGSGRGVDQECRVVQGMSGWSVWPGHSRWLFSGSLSIACGTKACFTYTNSHDWLSSVPAPGPS